MAKNLPFISAAASARHTPPHAAPADLDFPAADRSAAPPTLLLIDDSIAELRVLIDLLSARKWRVVVAFDGLDGYRKAVAKQPDLILLDVQMPGMDGFGTCRRLKADPRTRDIPVLFLTAAQDRMDRLTGLSIGAVDYVVKPYACEEEVLARVGIHLELAQRRSQPPVTAATMLAEVSEQSALVTAATSVLLEHLNAPPRRARWPTSWAPTRSGSTTPSEGLRAAGVRLAARTAAADRSPVADRDPDADRRHRGALRLQQRGEFLDRVPRALRLHPTRLPAAGRRSGRSGSPEQRRALSYLKRDGSSAGSNPSPSQPSI